MEPLVQTILDVSSFNTILIVCNVTVPQAVIVTNIITWRQASPSGTVQSLNHTGTDTNITYAGVGNSVSTSVLSLHSASAGTWRFTCSASLDLPNDPLIAHSETAEVIVKGT